MNILDNVSYTHSLLELGRVSATDNIWGQSTQDIMIGHIFKYIKR